MVVGPEDPRAQIENAGGAKSGLGSFEAYLKKTGYGSLEAALTSAKSGAVDAEISQEDFKKVANKVLTAVELAAVVVAKVVQTTEMPANSAKKMAGLSELALVEIRQALKQVLANKNVNIYDDKLIVTNPDGITEEVPIGSLMLHNGAELFIETIAYIEAAKLGKKDWKLAQQKMAELALHPAVANIKAFTEKVAQLKIDNPQLEPVINHEAIPPEFVLTAEEAAELAELTERKKIPEDLFSRFGKLVSTFDELGSTSPAEVLPSAHEVVLRTLLAKLGSLADELIVGTYDKSDYPSLLADSNGKKRYEQMLEYLQDVDRKNNIIKATKKTPEQEMHTMLDAWEAAVFGHIRINNLRLPTYLSGLEATLQTHPDGLDLAEKPHLNQALDRVSEVQTGGARYSDLVFDEAFRQKKEEKKREWEQRVVGLLGKVKEDQTQNPAQQGELPTRPQDEPALWEAYIDTLISMERFDLLLKEVRTLIMDRLNLVVESTSPNYGRKNELKTYSDRLSNIQITPGETNAAIKRELMKKAQEIEKIRTITDAAQVCANSASMAADWAGFATQESQNGLSVNYYDYFFFENDDGNRYKYAQVVEKAILELVDWHQFGEGVKWDDGPLWKQKQKAFVLIKIADYARANGLTISNEDRDEIWGIVYNICYGLGIRQHTFLGQYAMGATPGGKLGDLSKWLQAQFFHDHRYKTYKDVEFNPAAEPFEAPQAWTEALSAVSGLVYTDRLSSISKSILLTRSTPSTIAPLRKPCLMGVKEEGFNGPTLATTYHTLFEAVFLKARARAEQRKKKKDFTFANFVNGYEALLGYKEHAFAVPGGTTEGLEKKDPKELREKLIEDFGTLLKKHSSYLKKNAFSINWSHVAYITLMYVDKMFRVYRICDQTPAGSAELLKMVREQLKEGANNLAGLGKREEIYGVASGEPTAWHETEIYDLVNGKKVKRVERRYIQDYDIRDFVLNRIPITLEEYEGINPIGLLAARYASARDAAISVGPVKIGNTEEAKQRVMAKSGYGYLYRPIEKLILWWDKREMKALETFQHTALYIYGMPVAKQQQSPDKK